jgi:aminoglycoside phosphotransferase (APT) family kinase protein
MKLPEPTALPSDVGAAIATRHGLDAQSIVQLPQVGIINIVYLLGDDLVLRVPRAHPAHVALMYREAVAAPAARAVGVRTPRLVVFDDSLTLLPVPYTIYERVHGETLGLLDLEPAATPEAWRELGHDHALLHAGVSAAGPCGSLAVHEESHDPRDLVEERASEGWFTTLEARWLGTWLDRLAPAATATVPHRFVHRDVQATNVMVRARDETTYLALLDWGEARWGDPASDFGAIPLRAVPYALEGHRAVAPLDSDETAEARIVWSHLTWALYVLPRGATPNLSWAECPLAVLLEVLRFCLDQPGGRWRELMP